MYVDENGDYFGEYDYINGQYISYPINENGEYILPDASQKIDTSLQLEGLVIEPTLITRLSYQLEGLLTYPNFIGEYVDDNAIKPLDPYKRRLRLILKKVINWANRIRTSLTTLNMQTGSDTLGNATGFTGISSAISSVATESHSGTRSIRVDTNNSTANEAVYTDSIDVSIGYGYEVNLYIKLGAGVQLVALCYNDGLTIPYSNVESITGTGNWQHIVFNTTPTENKARIVVGTTTQQDITFYLDEINMYITG